MDMANLPATTTQTPISERQERFEDAIAEHIAAGRRPDEIARRVHPHNLRLRRNLRRRLWWMVQHDERLAQKVGVRARAELLMALGPAAAGLGRSAARGRPDAVKLLMEALGFHNPRVKHDHSGQVEIKLTMPRPTREAIDIPDADVVD